MRGLHSYRAMEQGRWAPSELRVPPTQMTGEAIAWGSSISDTSRTAAPEDFRRLDRIGSKCKWVLSGAADVCFPGEPPPALRLQFPAVHYCRGRRLIKPLYSRLAIVVPLPTHVWIECSQHSRSESAIAPTADEKTLISRSSVCHCEGATNKGDFRQA